MPSLLILSRNTSYVDIADTSSQLQVQILTLRGNKIINSNFNNCKDEHKENNINKDDNFISIIKEAKEDLKSDIVPIRAKGLKKKYFHTFS